MTKIVAYKPKPIIMEAYPKGAQNAQQAAIMRHKEAINKQTMMNTQTGGVVCPQAPTFGMPSMLNSSNSISCKTNSANWQRTEWAKFDTQVGKVNPNLKVGGKRKTYKRKNNNKKVKTSKNKRALRKLIKKQSNKNRKTIGKHVMSKTKHTSSRKVKILTRANNKRK